MTTSTPQDSGKILLAVDGSPSARSAAHSAAKLASVRSWRIHALYIVDIANALEPYTNIEAELSELGAERPENERRRITLLEEQGTLALEEVKGICEALSVPLTTEMIIGDISSIILDRASKYNLLALGRRGNRHQRESQHLGGNFRKIAHHTDASLLIGAEDDAHKFQHLLLAYDGSELSRYALDWAEALQTIFKNIEVLTIKEEGATPEWVASRQQELTNSALKHFDFIEKAGEPGETIARTASEVQADLLIMGGYRHSQLMEWATHSTLNIVLRETGMPVLAAK